MTVSDWIALLSAGGTIVAAVYAFRAFQATQASLGIAKQSLQHEQLNSSLATFYKIYDIKLSQLRLDNDAVSSDAMSQINRVFEIFLDDNYNGAQNLLRFQNTLYDEFKNQSLKPFGDENVETMFNHDVPRVMSTSLISYVKHVFQLASVIEALLNNLSSDEVKRKFNATVLQYLDSELPRTMTLLSKKNDEREWLFVVLYQHAFPPPDGTREVLPNYDAVEIDIDVMTKYLTTISTVNTHFQHVLK